MKRYQPLFERWLTIHPTYGLNLFINPSFKEFRECGTFDGRYIGGVRGIIYKDNLVIMEGGIHLFILEGMIKEGLIPQSKSKVNGNAFDNNLDCFLTVIQDGTSNNFCIGESYTKSFFDKIKDSDSYEYKTIMNYFEKMKKKNNKFNFICRKWV